MSVVDIIRYEDDIKVYAANALHPAKLESISVDENRRMLTIRVNSENSRLAFGKKRRMCVLRRNSSAGTSIL